MAPPLSTRAANWGTGLVINVLALSLASYVTLLYHYGTTRRVLAEAAVGSEADIHRQVSDDYGRNIAALLLSVLIGSVATAAGIGGGAFFVPLFNILLHFSLKGAIALSQAVIAGGAVAGVAVTLHKKHPHDPSRSLMDFDIALMLLPFQLLGVSIGMLANVLFPNWLVTMLLLGLLTFLTYKTVRKAWSLHRSEVRYLAQQDEQQHHRPATSEEAVSAANGPALHVPSRDERTSAEKTSCNQGYAASAKGVAGQAGAPVGESEERDQASGRDTPSLSEEVNRPAPSRQCASLEVEGLPDKPPSGRQVTLAITGATMSCAVAVGVSDDGRQSINQQPRVPSPQHAEISIHDAQHDGEDRGQEPPAWRQGAVLLSCWGVFVMFTLLLSHYHRCSPAYWSIFAVQAATCVGAEALFIRLVRDRKARQARSSARQPMLQSAYPEPLRWTPARLTRTVLITLISGWVAGLLGISGASIINPLLLEFGIHPQAAAATSTLMVLFTTSSAALSFGFGHQLNLQYALTFGLCCMGASLAGVVLVQRAVKRSGKASIIVFLLALVIATGGCLTAAFGGKIAILDLARHNNIHFNSLCSGDAS